MTAARGPAWGIRDPSDPTGLPLALTLLSAWFFLLTPVLNSWIRMEEAEADLFGINASGQPDGEAIVDLKLGEYRKLDPSPIEELLFFDHPSGRNRILMAMKWKAEHAADAEVNAARAAEDPSVLEVCVPRLYGPLQGTVFAPGQLSAAAGRAAYDAVVRAVGDAERGSVDAIATAPVNKEAFRLAGLPWAGHTDLLAHLTGSSHVAMLFHADALKVVLATIHIPLAEVPRALTRESLEATIDLTARAMPAFGIDAPRIAVAGLNPHAGEHGLFGREEIEVIGPVLEKLRHQTVLPLGFRL